MKLLFSAALLVSLVGCSSTSSTSSPKTIKAAVSSSIRSPEFAARDQYRHPVETLEFFGIRPDMKVIEILPSRGWYTQILAPYLSSKGQYIIAESKEDPRGYTVPRNEWYEKHPDLKKSLKKVVFQPGTEMNLGEDNSIDLIMTFRNLHNMTPKNIESAFKEMHRVLKTGGTLGVVEHRESPRAKYNPKSGYMHETQIINLANKAGFKLVESSEINANKKDTKNHPHGVWSLPPSLKGGDKDKAKYLAIGESDRMTLKFVK